MRFLFLALACWFFAHAEVLPTGVRTSQEGLALLLFATGPATRPHLSLGAVASKRARPAQMDETLMQKAFAGGLEEEGAENMYMSELGWAKYMDEKENSSYAMNERFSQASDGYVTPDVFSNPINVLGSWLKSMGRVVKDPLDVAFPSVSNDPTGRRSWGAFDEVSARTHKPPPGYGRKGLANTGFFGAGSDEGKRVEDLVWKPPAAYVTKGAPASSGGSSGEEAVQPGVIEEPPRPPQGMPQPSQTPPRALQTSPAPPRPSAAVEETVGGLPKARKFDVKQLAGISAPLGFFDPIGFTEDASEGKIRFYREVELKHGRVAMLAALGFLVAEQFHPLFGGKIDVPSYIAFQETPLQTFWSAVLFAIALLEVSSVFTFNSPFGGELWSIRSDYELGNLGFDPLNLKPTDPKELKDMQTKELNNGRLAMLAAAGMMAQELATGQKLF